MAWRIGGHIVAGELNNASRNSVHGWLEFGDDQGIRIALSGSPDGNLEGRHIRFRSSQAVRPQSADELSELANEQVGATGSMMLLARHAQHGDKPCLYLEWFGQNGRVVAEVVDPQIEYADGGGEVTPCRLPELDGDENPAIIAMEARADGTIEDRPSSPASNGDEKRNADSGSDSAAGSSGEKRRRRGWDEVIPGISEETKKMYEQWDEIVDGDKDEPLVALLDPPLSVPRPEQLRDEQDAKQWLKTLLARLAKHGVTLDVCKHFSPIDCYRLLIDEILPEAQVHPEMASAGFIQHYSTWEYCEECRSEFDEYDD